MADEDGQIYWYAPDPRAIIELDAFRVTRSLRKTVQREVFDLHVDRDFAGVIRACADRDEGTWISNEIIDAYEQLHELGFAHSVEAWSEGGLAGGLYGIAIGGAFFGESMFYRVRDASKVALVHLVARMRDRGFLLLDVQFMTEHLQRFGAKHVSRTEYLRRLQRAIRLSCRFGDADETET
jgi:leucyl/phenylalanyl-tRNA--protein transferase